MKERTVASLAERTAQTGFQPRARISAGEAILLTGAVILAGVVTGALLAVASCGCVAGVP